MFVGKCVASNFLYNLIMWFLSIIICGFFDFGFYFCIVYYYICVVK